MSDLQMYLDCVLTYWREDQRREGQKNTEQSHTTWIKGIVCLKILFYLDTRYSVSQDPILPGYKVQCFSRSYSTWIQGIVCLKILFIPGDKVQFVSRSYSTWIQGIVCLKILFYLDTRYSVSQDPFLLGYKVKCFLIYVSPS